MDWAGIDEWIYRRLTELVDVLPMRFVKLVAHNYTDARVRKLYWRRLGLEMGEGTYANLGLTLLSDDYTPRVHIGNHVSIAANVTFVPMASANNGQEINTYPYVRDHLTKAADIVVEDEVWIGADVTILPGVHIGRCAVIGAGSVVTGDVEAYHIYAGVPARKIRDIRTGEPGAVKQAGEKYGTYSTALYCGSGSRLGPLCDAGKRQRYLFADPQLFKLPPGRAV